MTDFTEEWIRLNNFKHAMQNEVGHFTDTDLDKRIIDRQLHHLLKTLSRQKRRKYYRSWLWSRIRND